MPSGLLRRFATAKLVVPARTQVEEVPGSQSKSKDSEAICHPCVTARVNLPAAPEGDGGGDDHEDAAERVHWYVLECEPSCMSASDLFVSSKKAAPYFESTRQRFYVVYPFGQED